MRKFIVPMLAATFLAVAGTAATTQTADAASVSVGIRGPGWGVQFNDGGMHRHRHFNQHRFQRLRNHCEPVYRTQWHWTRHGWKRMRVHVGFDCGPRYRWR
ncbi:MAG: hypothetical protein KDJ68_07110 [Rhodobiaceae bacterium]|nr:hypothetical protein [Rhodobiaceae bacterium]